MLYMVSYLISMVGVLLSVAFFTLVERKIMALQHFRKGPSKVSMSGVLQPMADAVKLLSKENKKMTSSKKMMFFLGPALAMAATLACWHFYYFKFSAMSVSSKSILIMFAIMSLSPLAMISMGWGSNSKYALMGAYRAVSQVVSYEVCFVCTSLVAMFTQKSFSFHKMFFMQENAPFVLMSPPLLMMWMVLCLSESNRTPFDHAESESELVSGFNVEYGAGLFAVIFIAEYSMILFLSFMTSVIFLGAEAMMVKTLTVSVLYIWARSSFPRLRYDKLMYTCWKILLPYSIVLMMGILCV